MKIVLPKTASQRAIAGLTSLALVAGGLTVMPYAGAQDEPNPAAAPVAAEPNAEATLDAGAEDAVLGDLAAAEFANAPQLNAALPTNPTVKGGDYKWSCSSRVRGRVLCHGLGGRRQDCLCWY